MKPTLDIEMMRKLYDFGEMLVYEVEYCDRLTMTVRVDLRTFNEGVARARCQALKNDGLTAAIATYFVAFDGAYNVRIKPPLFEQLGDQADKWKDVGERSTFYGRSASEMSRDELLVFLGCIGENHVAPGHQLKRRG
jgi:hypothetical protein